VTRSPVVVDAGPLVALCLADCLAVLHVLYGRVLVPDAVFREVVDRGGGRVGSDQVASATFLVRHVLDLSPDPLLAATLGPGESEVIALAYRKQARLTLIDERRARRIADQTYGLRVKGTVGVLVSAKRSGCIDHIRSILERMVAGGYYLSEDLLHRALQQVGE
jgi:hypothetical protein